MCCICIRNLYRRLLTPKSTVLHPHCDVDAVVLSSAVCQRLVQGHGVQHKPIIEAASDVVHLQEMSPILKHKQLVQHTEL